MRIIPPFPLTRASDGQLIKTVAYFLVLAAFLSVVGPTLVYPGVMLLLPAYLLTVLTSAGAFGFALCAAASVIYAVVMGGWLGGACLLLAVIPALLSGAACIEKEKPFLFSLLAGFGALFTGAALALALAMYATGGQLSAVLTARLESLLASGKHTDTILLYGYVSGLLPLTNSIAVPALALPSGSNLSGAVSFMGSSVVLNPEAREELLRALLFRFESGYCREVPGQLLSGAVLGAALLQSLPRRALRRRGVKTDLPALREWFIPAGKGRFVIAPMVISWLLVQCTTGAVSDAAYTYTSGAYILFSAFYAACSRIFALQGLALLDDVLYQGGRSRAARTAFAVAGFVLFGDFASFFGMADQAFDFRHLRRSPEDDDDYKQEDDF